MKHTLVSIAASSMLAAFAFAQPARSGFGTSGASDRHGHDRTRDPLAYVLTNDPQTGAAGFGAVHVASGAFVRIGGTLPSDLGHALAPARGGSLLSMAYSGKLYSIDPRTGNATVVGPTGLDDCTTPNSPCGPHSAVTLGLLDGKYYALDFSQQLYCLDPATGSTKLIGATGMPHVTSVPLSIDPSNGKLNVYDESLFTYRGKLYANFDSGQVDLSTGAETATVPAALYEINPHTGQATRIAPTDLGLLTIVNVRDTIYAYDSINNRFVTMDPETGNTKAVSNLDPSAGFVCGATPARRGSPDRD